MPHRKLRPLASAPRKYRQGTQVLGLPQFSSLPNPPGNQFFYASSAQQAFIQNTPNFPATSQNLILNTVAGFPSQYPYSLLLEWGTANQEVVSITQAPTGGGPYLFGNVGRGQDGTTAITHATGASVIHGVSARDFAQSPPVFNVCYYGADPTGLADSGPAIQNALLAASDYGGGAVCHVPPGRYITSVTLGIPPNVWFRGDGPGISTIHAVSGFSPPQNGNNGGMSVLQTFQNVGGNYIRISGLTIDGNQAGNLRVPSWADTPECAPVSLWSASILRVDDIEVINAIGYSLYLKYCTDFKITNCRVTSGQNPATGWFQQDGIHITDSTIGLVSGCTVDTGTNGLAGDDGIAVQAYGACSDITIIGNRVRAAAHGITLVASGGTVTDAEITSNDVWSSQAEAVKIYPDRLGGGLISGVTISGNTFGAVNASGSYNGLSLADYVAVGGTTAGWKDVSVTGNTFTGFTTSTGYGIFAGYGTGLAISNNVLDGMNTAAGIFAGLNTAVTEICSRFQITGNTVNMSTSAAANPVGIVTQDAFDGAISGNTVIGPGSGVSGGVGIKLTSVATAATGIAVTGNRISGFATPASENNFGAAPDYNSFADNIIHGCGTGTVVVGAHTMTGGLKLIQSTSATAGGTGTTAQSITGLIASLDVGTYYLEIFLSFEPTVTGGATSFGFTAASGLTLSAISMGSLIGSMGTAATAGTSALVTSTTLSDAMWTSPVATGSSGFGLCHLWGTLTVSAAGTLQVVFANVTSADTTTIAAGATMLIRSLA
jgi:hypothetical protein